MDKYPSLFTVGDSGRGCVTLPSLFCVGASGGKFDVYDGGFRVFAVFHWPGRILPNPRCPLPPLASPPVSPPAPHGFLLMAAAAFGVAGGNGSAASIGGVAEGYRRGRAAAEVAGTGGRRSNALASALDLFPTIVTLAQVTLTIAVAAHSVTLAQVE